MVILCSRDLQAMTDVDTALLASGIEDIVWHAAAEAPGAYELHVADVQDAERACFVLSAMWRDVDAPAPQLPAVANTLMWQQPAFAWGLGMAALLLAFYAVTGGSEVHSRWYRSGMFIHDPDVPYAPWRWLTAATLHGHMAHASGNAGMALLMFWAGTERIGHGLSSCIWVITAVAGFVASALFGPSPAWVVGASGGLFGLWGAICGHALRYPTLAAYKPRTRTVGVVVMLLGMMAFAHDADIAAHLGGCAAGVLLGLVCPRKPPGAIIQWAGVALASGALIWAWMQALAHVDHGL